MLSIYGLLFHSMYSANVPSELHLVSIYVSADVASAWLNSMGYVFMSGSSVVCGKNFASFLAAVEIFNLAEYFGAK